MSVLLFVLWVVIGMWVNTLSLPPVTADLFETYGSGINYIINVLVWPFNLIVIVVYEILNLRSL